MLRFVLTRRPSPGLPSLPALNSGFASAATSRAIRPRPIEQLCLEDVTSATFLSDCLRVNNPRPLHLVPRRPSSEDQRDLIDRILEEPDSERCIVEIEVGRYDRDVEKIQLPLSYYLRWLKEGGEGGQMNGKQVYLAQWRGLDDLPGLQRFLTPPRFLQDLIQRETIDLYQSSFFVGPRGAVTPLHYDPYINLFSLAGSSRPSATKHFLIFPPEVADLVKPGERAGRVGQNTSPLDFEMLRDGEEVRLSADSPSQGHAERLAGAAMGCTLRQGEMLLLPHRHWHRVENLGAREDWTAGIGYWFRLRS